MLGYICKYAPVEVFESMGTEMKRIEPDVTNFNQAEIRMHPNMCSFAKGVLEEMMSRDYEGIILTTCCDSIRRVYDVLREEFPDRFIYMLDTPRITKEAGVILYAQRIRDMIREYEHWREDARSASGQTEDLPSGQNSGSLTFSGETFTRFNEKTFARYLRKKDAEDPCSVKSGALNIGIIGARANDSIKAILKENGANAAFDLTCTGVGRKLLLDEKDVMGGYVRGLLSQFPCMRMEQASNRDELIRRFADSVDGVIYHTVQFCDNYSYEYAWVKEWLQKPMLLLETDYTRQSGGQVRTRIEAFLESLSAQTRRPKIQKKGDSTMYVMGIDSGSTSTNAVIMDQDRKIRAFSVVRTGAKSGVSADKVLSDVLEKAGLKREDISWIVSTGYGRVSIDFADENVTEISCHGKGAHYFNPKIRTILDIGGQDSKAIRLNENGEVKDFVMNDKCAAGTGRFLEMIARTLEVSLDDLGAIALTSQEKIEITSMCSVFAESEVISLIANNKEKADIADGVCHAIASKASGLLKRVGMEPEFMMTGGVAKNPGVVRAVEEKIGSKLYICEEPEIVGAAGAALYALEKCAM
ncbi:acyl-CoA dehydratase activase [Ruminococcus sp. CLA-AA-H200]|uniref:Acyl-CoA dehydratase activase n=1 Tax=Ruminococcus turbiniformis TaxID=2881258 RepID=A0ABS8FUD3_9FIRM|nr:acyl-CoA dehydratase activase [Ruminococcus turbiniformis]MCC2253635.1 acyl-CoA dehydratase activase [Ruminococcus turbiniformis]